MMLLNLKNKNDGPFFLWSMIIGILLMILFAFSSCNPQKHLNRFIKRNPGLVKIDTIKHMDTLIIRERRVDTLFYFNQHDTIIKEQDGVTIKYFYNSKDSTVYLEGKTKRDTIIREIRVPYQKIDAVLNPLTFIQKAKLFLFDWIPVVAVLLVLFLWVKSRLKPN